MDFVEDNINRIGHMLSDPAYDLAITQAQAHVETAQNQDKLADVVGTLALGGLSVAIAGMTTAFAFADKLPSFREYALPASLLGSMAFCGLGIVWDKMCSGAEKHRRLAGQLLHTPPTNSV